jgi:hypothetical protein
MAPQETSQMDDMKLVKYVSAKGTQVANWVEGKVCEGKEDKKVMYVQKRNSRIIVNGYWGESGEKDNTDMQMCSPVL